MRCHSCQTERPLAPSERLGFREACERCASDLHVCLNCRHHDPSAYNECRETNAERVADRDRGNRCDYFSPRVEGGAAAAPAASDAKAQLDALFKKP